MKFRITSLIIIFAIISTTLVGCINNNNSDEVNRENTSGVNYLITEDGQVVLPLTNFNTLNPLMTDNSSYHYFSKLIYDGLFEFDNNLEPIPELVESYNIVNEGRTISLKLKPNLYWHDGEKFTSTDVDFTINTMKYASKDTIYYKIFSNAVGNNYDNEIKEVRVIDDYNVDINFANGFSNNLEVLTFPIIPRHAFNNGGGNKDFIKALELDNYNPVGTGPYKFVNYDKFKSVTLKANEHYRGGKPSIELIVGKVLENEELILTAFETGQINVATALEVDWDKYKQNSRINTLEYVSPDYEFLGFNFTNPLFSSDIGSSIRKAINYGIDRQEIIRKLYLGHGTQIDVPINPQSWLVSQESNSYGYDVDTAKDILLREGFVDTDGDGILEDENGLRLSFRLLTNPSNILRLKTAEMIRDDLNEIGIEIIFDFDSRYKDDITNEHKSNEWQNVNAKLQSGDFDIALLGWQLSIVPNLSLFLHGGNLGVHNFINYQDEKMDILLAKINEGYQREDKIINYQLLQEHIVEELPYVSMYFRNKALLVDSKIMGELNPTYFNPYNGLEKCFIAIPSE